VLFTLLLIGSENPKYIGSPNNLEYNDTSLKVEFQDKKDKAK
jgi:hypothetical protein